MENQVKHPFNAELFPYDGEVNNEPSQTVPDQSLGLRELLVRYAKGLPLEGTKTPIFEGEDGSEIDVDKLDLAEREELANQAREELKHLSEKIKGDIEKAKSKKKSVVTDVEDISETSQNEK
jgi:hypothetical protein